MKELKELNKKEVMSLTAWADNMNRARNITGRQPAADLRDLMQRLDLKLVGGRVYW